MKKEEVQALAKEFMTAMEEEKELRAKLLDLKMVGSEDEVDRALDKHDAMVERIGELREKKMLPILETLGSFIADKTGKSKTPQESMRDAVNSGKERVKTGRIHDHMLDPAEVEATKEKKKKPKKSGAKSKGKKKK